MKLRFKNVVKEIVKFSQEQEEKKKQEKEKNKEKKKC